MLDYSSRVARKKATGDKVFQSFFFSPPFFPPNRKIPCARPRSWKRSWHSGQKGRASKSWIAPRRHSFCSPFCVQKTHIYSLPVQAAAAFSSGERDVTHRTAVHKLFPNLSDSVVPVAGFQIATFPKCGGGGGGGGGGGRGWVCVSEEEGGCQSAISRCLNYRGEKKSGRILSITPWSLLSDYPGRQRGDGG